MTGRPTKLTPEVQATIVAAIREGNYPETAAQAAGVCRRTYYNWREWGEAGQEPYADFMHAVKKAEAEAEISLQREIRHARSAESGGSGADIWQARSWVMERRWPARWGGRVRLTVSDERETLLAKVQKDPELHERLRDVLDQGDPTGSAAPAAAH